MLTITATCPLTEFKYLGSTLQSDGDMNTEVNMRAHCGWSNWRKMPCVLCDNIVPLPVKGHVHTMIVRASYAVRDGDGAND